MRISFNTANYVGLVSGFQGGNDWGPYEVATNSWYSGIEKFEERFHKLAKGIRSLGFDAADVWTAHCNWMWSTEEHLNIARKVFADVGLSATSYGGYFGDNEEEFHQACITAALLQEGVHRENEPVLMGGNTSLLGRQNENISRVCRETGTMFCFENHPDEKTPDDVLKKIDGTDPESVGLCVDTGWFGVNNYDAYEALKQLYHRVRIVHLKDIRAAGGHETCRLGDGVVPVRRCFEFLLEQNFTGIVSIEHEPFHYDPSAEAEDGLRLLNTWAQ